MKILKKAKEPNAPWQPITKEECLKLTEGGEVGGGYWKKDTVLDMLEDGHIVQTPWALFMKKAV